MAEQDPGPAPSQSRPQQPHDPSTDLHKRLQALEEENMRLRQMLQHHGLSPEPSKLATSTSSNGPTTSRSQSQSQQGRPSTSTSTLEQASQANPLEPKISIRISPPLDLEDSSRSLYLAENSELTLIPKSSGSNPFLLEPFLRHLSVFMDHGSLKAARQVCLSWYLFLTPAFMRKSKLVANFPLPTHAHPFFMDSDSDEDSETGWKTVQNFQKIYPFEDRSEDHLNVPGSQPLLPPKSWKELSSEYWLARAGVKPSSVPESSRYSRSETQLILKNKTEEVEMEEKERFDLSSFGLDLSPTNRFYMLPPPVPETLEILGSSCPPGWLRTYGRFVKRLHLDFGTFVRRDRTGEMDPGFIVRILDEFCPNLKSLKIVKPNYLLDPELGPLAAHLRTPGPHEGTIMSNYKFWHVTSLEIVTYRADRTQCVREFLRAFPNLENLTLSLFTISGDIEDGYMNACKEAGYLENLKTLHFPIGMKAPTIAVLASVDYKNLKVLTLGRIRQNRWIHPPRVPQPQDFLDPAVLNELLQKTAGTLEQLRVNFNLTHPDEIWLPLSSADWPILPFLKKLDYKFCRPEFTDSFQFLDNFPSLEELELQAETFHDHSIARKLVPENFDLENLTLTSLIMANIPVEFSLLPKLVRMFPNLKVFQCFLMLGSLDPGNDGIRRPLSRHLFKLRKFKFLEDLKIKSMIVERDDFSYSIGFCFRYMKALKHFSFQSVKTIPNLTKFAVDSGFLKAPNLITLELDNFFILDEDREHIETALKRKLLRTKLINCVISSPLKNGTMRTELSYFREGFQERWSYQMEKFSDPDNLLLQRGQAQPRSSPSLLSLNSSDTESLEFAIASI